MGDTGRTGAKPRLPEPDLGMACDRARTRARRVALPVVSRYSRGGTRAGHGRRRAAVGAPAPPPPRPHPQCAGRRERAAAFPRDGPGGRIPGQRISPDASGSSGDRVSHMPRTRLALTAMLASLVLPSAAHAGWSAPVTLSRTSTGPAAVAADSAGDSAVAWATVRGLPPKSMDRYCALHPFKPSCYGISSVHVAVRTSRGRVVTRTVWEGRSGEMGMSLVIAHGEATLGWGAYDVSDPNETAREVHGPLLGLWSRAKVLGHFLDYLITGGHTPLYPQLAVAPDGTVLAAWSACGSLQLCPGAVPGVTLAWRAPGRDFGGPHKVALAPEGSVPSFDSAGAAYLHSSCSARVLLSSPGSHAFRRVVTLTRGPVRDLSLGLSGAGEGLVSWIPTPCSTDEAAGSLPGPVLASRLHGEVFAP